jgi:hypothetical protein
MTEALREEILDEIRRLAEAAGGKAPGKVTFAKETGISEGQWSGRFWARWSDAVREAGLQPNTLQQPHASDDLLAAIAVLVRTLGRIPTSAEMKLERRKTSSFPNFATIENRFGRRSDLVAALRAWASKNADNAELLALLPNEPTGPANTMPSLSGPADGCVYLMKSGASYKIGRSDDIERRFKQVTVAMPDKVTIVHSIRTDDPPGIEAYWHRRFAERRLNGEWFRLTPSDIAAFRKRRFQ